MTFLLTYFGLTVFLTLTLMSAHKLFEKAGKTSKEVLTPFINFKVALEITGKPMWYMVFLFIPVANFFVFISMFVDLAKCFGKTDTKDHIFAMLLPPVFLWRLGNDASAKYLGKVDTIPKVKKSFTREWSDAILFAVYAASIVRWATFEAFTIPTPSMEGSLNVGDYLFVSKAHYGIRMPQTVAMIPLLHNRIPILNTESYLKSPSLKYTRLPAITNVKRNDPFVFNWPAGDSVYITPSRSYSVDQVRRNPGIQDPGLAKLVRNKQLPIN